MKPLLIAGYSAVFVVLFAYVLRLQRKVARLERRLDNRES
ncbi:MAG: CcmD family protein [Halodesulfurarchaeum sp.]